MDMFAKGVAIRDEMLGPEHGSAKLAGLDDFTATRGPDHALLLRRGVGS